MVLEAIKYDGNVLKVLDQLQLPFTTKYDEIHSCEEGFDAIKQMRVRGAPLIAMVAALSLATEINDCWLSSAPSSNRSKNVSKRDPRSSPQEAESYVQESLDYLLTSRPTAVNLQDCAQKLKKQVATAKAEPEMTAIELLKRYVQQAVILLESDLEDNQKIGAAGSEWIVKHAGNKAKLNVLTHCNTGSLATSGYGTALGVIRALNAHGRINKVYCTETRPYNQGSRLTAYELVHDNIDACLVTDSMVAALMKQKGIDAVVVGADRVVRNGDTANKIGTYNIAIAAKYHKVPFLVAAPLTTIDAATKSGTDIKIEERAPIELTTVSGPTFNGEDLDLGNGSVRIKVAANGIDVWNPAFDVTPASLIEGIITEIGVIEKNAEGAYDLDRLTEGNQLNGTTG